MHLGSVHREIPPPTAPSRTVCKALRGNAHLHRAGMTLVLCVTSSTSLPLRRHVYPQGSGCRSTLSIATSGTMHHASIAVYMSNRCCNSYILTLRPYRLSQFPCLQSTSSLSLQEHPHKAQLAVSASVCVRLATDAGLKRASATDQVHALVAGQTMPSACSGTIISRGRPCVLSLMDASERRRLERETYPKGYVEMLEQQQAQLVSALKEMYYRLQKTSSWEGPSLDEGNGYPLTHDILSALDLIEMHHDSVEVELLENNDDKLQLSVGSDDTGLVYRRGYTSQGQEYGNSHRKRPRETSSEQGTLVQPKRPLFTQSSEHPVISQDSSSRSKASLHQQTARSPVQHPPVQQPPTFTSDPPLCTSSCEEALVEMKTESHTYSYRCSEFGMFDGLLESARGFTDSCLNSMASDDIPNMPNTSDLFHLDTIELDFSEFVWQQEVTDSLSH